ncbi:MAG: gamma-glutamyltransferase family protein [Proteobacteria bacterium]|nr:gamma-glutamyltransferase family protein [Pseudomonadota bacterium]
MDNTFGTYPEPNRPTIMGTNHVVAAGHYMSAQAGFQVLEAGGNAVDAGVAAGIATGVLEGGYTNIGGVAPIILHMAETGETVTISGLGTWPKKATCEYFQKNHGGKIPQGLHRTVIPAAPDAWITALARYGTMSFSDVANHSIRIAREGFPMYARMYNLLEVSLDGYRSKPSSAAIFLRDGKPPPVGSLFVQTDLAKTLQYMADEEKAHAKGDRKRGLKAARDAFYKGDIARTIADYHAKNDGLVTMEDMAGFRVGIEPPVMARFGDWEIYGCGPWCQGPMLMQIMNLMDGNDLKRMGLNSADYVHTVTEAIKLAAADREAYYGDPRFVDVPIAELLSDAYSRERRKLIDPAKACPEMPRAGAVKGGRWPEPERYVQAPSASPVPIEKDEGTFDTSYLCAIDKWGNAFSATPSDGSRTSPVIPGLGFVPSSRGSQSRVDPKHPSSVAPGKRPRLTPNPALAIQRGKTVMPFGTPGGDVQVQAMAQAFINVAVFGMDPQNAIEQPRFASYSFPSSFAPNEYRPGQLNLEGRFDRSIGDELSRRGHKIEWWPDKVWMAGSLCVIRRDVKTGVLQGGADPRRTAYAIGW